MTDEACARPNFTSYTYYAFCAVREMLPFSVWCADHSTPQRLRSHLSATMRRDHSSRPLWCLSATEEYSLLLPLGSLYEAFPDPESSTHTNTPTPQMRKKRNKHMKGQSM